MQYMRHLWLHAWLWAICGTLHGTVARPDQAGPRRRAGRLASDPDGAGGMTSTGASRIAAQSTSCTSTGTESLQIVDEQHSGPWLDPNRERLAASRSCRPP